MMSWRVWVGMGLVLACVACGAPPTRSETAVVAQFARTCAPWDGAAFVVSVPVGNGADPAALPALQLSVWSPPQFERERKIVFVEGDDRAGLASYVEAVDHAVPLAGEATFRQTAGGGIEGALRLQAADGRRFERRFRGRLDDRVVMCG